MIDPESPQHPEPRRDQTDAGDRSDETRAPFDTSELEKIPGVTDEDPPYRSWWVVTDHDKR